MTNQPLISVIIPVYNRRAGLRRAVASVAAQRGIAGEGLELIAVDDGSDPPVDAADFAEAVRVIRLETNSGPAAARNAGIKASNGRYLAFLDSDDVWLPDKLADQLGLARRLADSGRHDPARTALACGFVYPSRGRGELELRVPCAGTTLEQFASGCWFVPGSALFIHRSAFEATGLLEERLRRLEDLDWFIRFARGGGELCVTPEPGAVIAPSGQASPEAVAAAAHQLRRVYGPRGSDPLPGRAWRRLSAYLQLERAAGYIDAGRRVPGLWHLAASLALKPRLQGAVVDFWERDHAVPQAARDAYEDLQFGR